MPFFIQTPSRLHFGLIDLNGELGRINGGLGVAIEEPFWQIIGFNDKLHKKTDNIDLINKITSKFDDYFKTNSEGIFFEIIEKIPRHIGLGSNTQFHLAIGLLLTQIHKISTSIREIANIIGRGGTSGIGVAAFEKGGFILDGGHSFGPGKQTEEFKPSSISTAPPPPIIIQHNPPKEWQFIIISPKHDIGSHGEEEIDLFKEQCPIPREDVEKLSRLILVKILPALIENNIKVFGEGLTEMQTNFSKFGMEKYETGLHKEILDYLRNDSSIFGSGISSFGPTIFALTNNENNAQNALNNLNQNFHEEEFSLLLSTSINTTGARVKILKKIRY